MVAPLLDPLFDPRPVLSADTTWYEVQGRYEPAIEMLALEGIDIGEMPYRQALKFIRDIVMGWIEKNAGEESYLVEIKSGKIAAAFENLNDAFAFKMRFG